MKLTDQKVAKALGWAHPEKENTWAYWMRPDGAPFGKEDLPPWTTSLNAITAEYYARKIRFNVAWDPTGAWAEADGSKRHFCVREDTAPLDQAALALCAALLAYLKEHP